MMEVDNETETEIQYETIELETARDAVIFSFIVHKSVTYLDLSASEISLKRKCCFTEEQCRKFIEPRRRLLYTLNLDLPKGLEGSLRTATPNADDEECGAFHLGIIFVCDGVYRRNLTSVVINSIVSSTNQMDKLGRCFSILRLLKMQDCRVSTTILFNSLMPILYPHCRDSNFVVQFAINLKFHSCILNAECPWYVSFVLHHAMAIGFNIWQETEWRLDPVNGCIIFCKPGNVGALLAYGTEFFFDFQAYLDFLGRLLEPRQISCLFLKNIPHRIFYLTSQLLYCYVASNRLWEALPYIWRSIPDPYFTERDFLFLFEGVISVEQIQDMMDLYKRYVVEGTEEIIDAVPRRLQHLCRVVIRIILTRKNQLPYGIYQLPIVHPLMNYLNLYC